VQGKGIHRQSQFEKTERSQAPSSEGNQGVIEGRESLTKEKKAISPSTPEGERAHSLAEG